MSRSIDDIQRDIQRSREQLATTLDQLVERSNPKTIAGDATNGVVNKLKDPTVQAILAVSGVVVAGLVVLNVARGRRKRSDLKELQRLLKERR